MQLTRANVVTMKRWIVVLLIAGCAKKPPSRAERCNEAADHLAAVSTARMPDSDRKRVLASCTTWPDATLDCLLSAKNDAEIDGCAKALRH